MNTRTRLLAAGATLAFGAVSVALVSQHALGMQPCAWCVLQRAIYTLLGALCLAGMCLPRFSRLAAVIGLIVAAAGASAAWYQHTVAANLTTCARSFAERVITSSGLDDFMPAVFGIYASCMDAKSELMGIEYALWSLSVFAVALLLTAIASRRN